MLDEGNMIHMVEKLVSKIVILMTSNVGTKLKEFGAGIGFSSKTKEDNKDDEMKSVLKKS
jgi:ATP-dependent Clp protease ATP-binding subunit ClpA